MGFFNIIETFFFLSLGITFVLILLLVYHFKQRLSSLENKCDTVFEIISNIVKELNNIKHIQTSNTIMMNPNTIDFNTNIPFQPLINNKIKCGFVGATEDYKAMAKNIIKVYEMSNKQRKILGKNATEYHKNNLSRDIILDKLLNFIFS